MENLTLNNVEASWLRKQPMGGFMSALGRQLEQEDREEGQVGTWMGPMRVNWNLCYWSFAPRGLQLWHCECPLPAKLLLSVVMLDMYWTRSQRSKGGYSRSWTCYEPNCCLFRIPDQVNQQNKQPSMWDTTVPFALLQNSECNKNMAISFFCLPSFP